MVAFREAITPRLKHKHMPKMLLPVSPAREMFGPFCSNRPGIEKPLISKPLVVEESFRPIPHGPPDPGIDRHAEAHLGPVDQLARDVASEDLSQQPLPLTIPNF